MEQIAEFSEPWFAPQWSENSTPKAGVSRFGGVAVGVASVTRGVLALWDLPSPPLHLLTVLATVNVAVSGAAGVHHAASSNILLPVVPDFAQR